MRPTDYIASLFKPSGGPGGESAAYDFDPIGSYFYNCPAEEGVFQIVDAETTADLDLNAVFEKIDRTTSRVGQQYLYARLRTLRGEEDTADFDRRVGAFENDDELTQRPLRQFVVVFESTDPAVEIRGILLAPQRPQPGVEVLLADT